MLTNWEISHFTSFLAGKKNSCRHINMYQRSENLLALTLFSYKCSSIIREGHTTYIFLKNVIKIFK